MGAASPLDRLKTAILRSVGQRIFTDFHTFAERLVIYKRNMVSDDNLLILPMCFRVQFSSVSKKGPLIKFREMQTVL